MNATDKFPAWWSCNCPFVELVVPVRVVTVPLREKYPEAVVVRKLVVVSPPLTVLTVVGGTLARSICQVVAAEPSVPHTSATVTVIVVLVCAVMYPPT